MYWINCSRWYGMVWYGMVWYGMVWYGMVWYGMVWYGNKFRLSSNENILAIARMRTFIICFIQHQNKSMLSIF